MITPAQFRKLSFSVTHEPDLELPIIQSNESLPIQVLKLHISVVDVII